MPSFGVVSDVVYRTVFRRTSTFVLAIVAGGFLFERGFDKTSNYIFETYNKGKLWKDIKSKYENKEASADTSDESE